MYLQIQVQIQIQTGNMYLQTGTAFLYSVVKCKSPRWLILLRKRAVFHAIILKFSFSSSCVTNGDLWTTAVVSGLENREFLPPCTATPFQLLPHHFWTFHIVLLCHNQLFIITHACQFCPHFASTLDRYLGYLSLHSIPAMTINLLLKGATRGVHWHSLPLLSGAVSEPYALKTFKPF